MTVLISFSIMLALAAGFSVWVALGLGGLVGLTGGIAAFCQSIFVQCLAYSHVAKVVFLWLGALSFASGLILGFYRGAGRLLRAHMAVKRLPVRATAGSIVLVDIEKRAAFTHGLLNPKIYLSRGLLKGLEHEELK